MAKLIRYNASPIPIDAPNVRSGGLPSEGSIGPAIQQAGNAVQNFGELKFKADYHRMQLDDEIQYAIATQKYQEALNFETDAISRVDYTQDEPLSQDDPDYFKKLTAFDLSQRDKTANESIKKFYEKVGQLQYGFKTKNAQANFEAFKIRANGDAANAIRHEVNKKYTDYQLAKFDNLTNDALANMDLETANRLVDIQAENNLITEVQANRKREQNQIAYQKAAEEKKDLDIMTGITAVVNNEWEKSQSPEKALQAGYDFIRKSIEEGTMDANDDYKYGQKLDLYVGNRYKKQKENDYRKNLNFLESNIPLLRSGELTPEIIAQSDADEIIKSDLQNYAIGANEPSPQENQVGGFSGSVATVLDFSFHKMNKQEAIDELLESRYIDKSITDEQFDWAIKKLDEPYDKKFLPDLRKILKSNQYDYNGWWTSSEDEQNAMEVNENLLNWVDGQIKENHYPTPDEMYERSRLYREGGSDTQSIEEPVSIESPLVITDADFEALEPGTIFVDEQGQRWRK